MSGQLRYAPRQALAARQTAVASSRAAPGAAARVDRRSFLSFLSLRGEPAEIIVIVLYLSLSRAYLGDASTLGIKIGPVPLFLTDAVLLMLIALTIFKRGGQLVRWSFGGVGAGEIGWMVWVLCLMSVVYCFPAFPRYHIMALRDLAIFGYSVFFPLTYFALGHRTTAAKLVRYFVYATCIGCVLFEVQAFSGIRFFDLSETGMALKGSGAISRLTAGNLDAALGPALAGLFAYLVADREHQLVHAVAMLLCLVTLIQILDRTSMLGFSVAAAVISLLRVGRSRIYLIAVGAGLLALVLLSADSQLPIPGGASLHNMWLGLSSGANYQTDPDAQFRLQRWRSTTGVWLTDPIFGVGFGAPIQLETFGVAIHTRLTLQKGGLGAFNVGLPHNSFLTILARMGLIGFGLIGFAWAKGIIPALKLTRRRQIDADRLAAASALIAMIFTAALNLFFERPMLCAPFWIMLAASYRLSQSGVRKVVKRPIPTAVRGPVPFVGYLRPSAAQNQAAGSWQARWT